MGDGFLSATKDHAAEGLSGSYSWVWVHGESLRHESVADRVAANIYWENIQTCGVARPGTLVAERNRSLPRMKNAENEIQKGRLLSLDQLWRDGGLPKVGLPPERAVIS
jgi:hypothetical protein